MDNFNLKKYITEGKIYEERKQTLNDFISAAEAYLKAGGAADEYVSDEKIKKTAQFLYNQYLQGVNIEDLFENSDRNKIYHFSEYDFDITTEPGYQEEVIQKIKSSHPDIEDGVMMKLIRNVEDYYYGEARKENKRGRDYDPIDTDEFANAVIMGYEDQAPMNENSDSWRHHILSDNEAKALIKNLGLELEDAGNIGDPENGPSMEDSYYEVYAGKYKGHTIRIDYSSDMFGSDWDLTLFDESQLDIVGDE